MSALSVTATQSVKLFGWWRQPILTLSWNDVKQYHFTWRQLRSLGLEGGQHALSMQDSDCPALSMQDNDCQHALSMQDNDCHTRSACRITIASSCSRRANRNCCAFCCASECTESAV